MQTNLVALVLILCLLTPGISIAQSQREVLTNAKVIELVRLGLSEALIVAKINRSQCQCDTSTDAIAKLKAAKVTDGVIMAMMNSSVSPSQLPESDLHPQTKKVESISSPPLVDSTALGKITEPGIYLFAENEMQAIEPSVFSGSKMNPLMSGLTYGIKKSKFKAKIRGRSANVKTSNSKPVFYFVFNPDFKNSGATMAGNMWLGLPATSPNEFMMVQMSVEEASRQAVLGEYGVWTGMKTGARDKDVREYSFEKIRTGVYKVVPKEPLLPGEYCFYYAGNVTGFGFAGGKIFDFSVQ